jgi:hypothetical protein
VIFDDILDDAALFPPGNAPAELALPAHAGHRRSPRARYMGPFVVPALRAVEIATVWSAGAGPAPLDIALTFGGGLDTLDDRLTDTENLDQIRVVAVEVATPDGVPATVAVSAVTAALPQTVCGFMEVPRDERRGDVIVALADTGLRAKFRTGGTTADAYPDERELADAIHQSVAHCVSFKATAGLHHAVRNTDTATGFEQHGFLNMIVAVGAAGDGAGPAELAAILRSRDGAALAESITTLSVEQTTAIRQRFLSFGTCSIIEPLEDLAQLGLVPAEVVDRYAEVAQP